LWTNDVLDTETRNLNLYFDWLSNDTRYIILTHNFQPRCDPDGLPYAYIVLIYVTIMSLVK
jgi:hypothetical protein